MPFGFNTYNLYSYPAHKGKGQQTEINNSTHFLVIKPSNRFILSHQAT